jgi:hypothetical protein
MLLQLRAHSREGVKLLVLQLLPPNMHPVLMLPPPQDQFVAVTSAVEAGISKNSQIEVSTQAGTLRPGFVVFSSPLSRFNVSDSINKFFLSFRQLLAQCGLGFFCRRYSTGACLQLKLTGVPPRVCGSVLKFLSHCLLSRIAR